MVTDEVQAWVELVGERALGQWDRASIPVMFWRWEGLSERWVIAVRAGCLRLLFRAIGECTRHNLKEYILKSYV